MPEIHELYQSRTISTIAATANEKHLFESIPPNNHLMLFTDHDMQGGVNELRKHQEGVLEVPHELFRLLGLPEQKPVVLTSHRTKEKGDYLVKVLRYQMTHLSKKRIESKSRRHHWSFNLACKNLSLVAAYMVMVTMGKLT